MYQKHLLELNRVWSKKKKAQVLKILEAAHPTHDQRLWASGFLFFCGYKEKEIVYIFKNLSKWNDFNLKETKRQVKSVCESNQKRKEWKQQTQEKSETEDTIKCVSLKGNKSERVLQISGQKTIFDIEQESEAVTAKQSPSFSQALKSSQASRLNFMFPSGVEGSGEHYNEPLRHCGFNLRHVKEILEEIEKNGVKGHSTQDKPSVLMNCEFCHHPACAEALKYFSKSR